MKIEDYGLSFGNLSDLPKSKVEKVVIHHFGAGSNYGIKNAHRDHSSSRRNNAGISQGLGYNGAVDTDGTKVKGRMWKQGAHCRGHNQNSFGLVTPGNFDNIKPTEKVLESMAEFTAWVLKECNLPLNSKTVVGHRDVGTTSCPGENFDMSSFRNRVKKYMEGVSSSTSNGLLRRGDSGSKVKQLQEDLLEVGGELPDFGADGDFGKETEDAVKAFQARYNLTVDGIAGPKTLSKLEEVLNDMAEQKPNESHKEAWQKATEKDIFNGRDPRKPITREQVATVLNRLGLLDK
ncbi:N-acetylmuramoyl-L-alanine amidase [Alteribacillus sp. JSM 102045]|uniref:peptidoglycan recognition protein family protein n=1 Tax=Alteribacillus sp. JSM 102045 TaxID=1562101 RepID=UPI0035BFBEDF